MRRMKQVSDIIFRILGLNKVRAALLEIALYQ